MANSTYGAIKLSTANDVGAMLKKKMESQTGFKPSEWADEINLMGKLPVRTSQGSIASFSDGADDVPCVSVVANIVPIQDLHGYDNPWIGGAGSNKWDEQWELGGFNSLGEPIPADDRIRSVNFTPIQPNTSYYFKTTNTLGVRYYDANKDFISGANGTNTALTTPSNAYYLKLLILNTTTYGNDVAVNYPSSVTTYSPYENICPISGHTECEVTQQGANLLDISEGEIGKWIDSSGNETTALQGYVSEFIKTTGTTIKTNVFGQGDVSFFSCSICEYDKEKNFIRRDHHTTASLSSEMTDTLSNTTAFVKFQIYLNGGMTQTALDNGDIMVSFDSATTYEPYKSETYTKALGQTVYSGSLNLVSGLLTIDKVKEVRRWDSARSSGSSVGDYWRKSFELANATIASTVDTECSVALYYAAYSSNTLHYYIDSSARLMLFLPNDTADSYEFEICYPLATPIEVQLTPEEVRTFLWANNFWADTGDTEVEYRADIELLIAELEGNRAVSLTRNIELDEELQSEEEER